MPKNLGRVYGKGGEGGRSRAIIPGQSAGNSTALEIAREAPKKSERDDQGHKKDEPGNFDALQRLVREIGGNGFDGGDVTEIDLVREARASTMELERIRVIYAGDFPNPAFPAEK